MKRLLKWLAMMAGGLVAVAVLFVLSGYLVPAEIELELEHRLEAPTDEFFELFTTYDGVTRLWAQANQDMGESFDVRHLGGPDSGVGMRLGFGSPGGPVLEEWTYVDLERPGRVQIDVDFGGIFISHRTLELSADDGGTNVRWSEVGTVESPIWRWVLRMFRAGAIENRRVVLAAAGSLLGG